MPRKRKSSKRAATVPAPSSQTAASSSSSSSSSSSFSPSAASAGAPAKRQKRSGDGGAAADGHGEGGFDVAIALVLGLDFTKVDWRRGRRLMREAADAGDLMAQAYVCRWGFHGPTADQKVKADNRAALKLFREVATSDDPHPHAVYAVGKLFHNGAGTKKNIKQAVSWYIKGVDAGSACAMRALAQCYHQGIGVEKSYARAAELYSQSAEKGNTNAMVALGEMYELSLGVRRNLKKAVNSYEQAASLSHPAAQGALGRMYWFGNRIITQDKQKAVELWLECKKFFASTPHKFVHKHPTMVRFRGCGLACLGLARCHEFGLVGQAKDISMAVALYNGAIWHGFREAKADIDRLNMLHSVLNVVGGIVGRRQCMKLAACEKACFDFADHYHYVHQLTQWRAQMSDSAFNRLCDYEAWLSLQFGC
jgi:TPR repeat protein